MRLTQGVSPWVSDRQSVAATGERQTGSQVALPGMVGGPVALSNCKEVFVVSCPPNLPSRPMPRPTAQVELYVEALGAETAVRFLLKFGGGELYQGKSAGNHGMVTLFLG